MPVKYSDIKKKLKLEVDKKTGEGLAHLTHYFQNHENGVSEYFKPSVKQYLADLHKKLSIIEEPDFQYYLPIKWDIPFPPPPNPKFKFIDLFAGIGGIRLAYQNLGGKCVFTSEWNDQAKRTYEANFGKVPFGDAHNNNLGVPLRVGLFAPSPAQKPPHKSFTRLSVSIPHAIRVAA
jgi:DNA (cytosine-5)-methyltransferase 1